MAVSRERMDWVSHPRSYVLAWGLPTAALIAGVFLDPPAKPLVWAAALVWMGGACLANAARCGRTHCYLTGPFFLLMAVAALLHGFAIVPLGPHGWLGLGVTIGVGGAVLWWWSEAVWGKFVHRREQSTDPGRPC